MKVLFYKAIIYLFEKYAYGYWVDLQIQEQRNELKLKYNCEDSELDELMVDLAQEPYSRAYDAGREDGRNDIMDDPRRYFG